MARKYPDGYYVYLHYRESDGVLFYVGIGNKYRAWRKTGRNAKWTNIFNKHGRSVEIISHGFSRDDALAYEVAIISYYRSIGVDLANKTDGGDGVSGLKFTDDSKVKMSRSQGGKTVHCSNGMIFTTGQKAADWLNENGQQNALSGHISACCRGDRTAAYGFSWWYDGDNPKPHIPRYERLSMTTSTKVYCSNGMDFRNANEAAKWLKANGHQKAGRSGVEGAIYGKYYIAYGFSWWIDGQEPKSHNTQLFKRMMSLGKRVVLDDCVCFFSLDCAVEYLKRIGFTKAAKSSITRCAQGELKSYYGMTWKYADDTTT